MKKAIFVLLLIFVTRACAQSHSVTLTWTASTDATANPTLTYNMYRAPGSCAATFVKLNTAPISALTFADTTVTPGQYCYQATAVLNGLESVPSNSVLAVIPVSPPTSLSITVTK